MQVGHKIKKVREFKDFTQEYMAEKLKMTQQSYSKIERDEVAISMSRLEQIAQILGVKVEDITSFDEKFVFSNNSFSFSDYSANISYNQTVITELKKAYELQIDTLKEEIQYLKSLVDKLMHK